MGLFSDGFKELKKASEPLYKAPKSIQECRVKMGMTQEKLAEALITKKSTISAYENDKIDIKGSILVEISEVLDTSVNYLLGQEEYDEDLLEIITVYKSLKDPKIKGIALEQMKLLATIHPEH